VRASLGILGVAIGASSAGLGLVVYARGLVYHDERFLLAGRRCVFGVLIGAVIAVGAMEWALLSHDFSLRYVAENNARATPLLFTITGLWAALEGSILLWSLILGGYLAFVAHRFRARANDPLVAWANVVGLVVALFFFALMLGPANPFRTLGAVPPDGNGPNALLQNHPLMAFHPPLLYLGLVGFTVPFAFAVAGLITGRFGEGWLTDTRRSALFAWGCLSVGLILGAWWSYEVLGWGGFWAWDPVENAALLPWLTATAFLHSVIVQERRGMLRVWNLSLVISTFSLTILATFLTRSGVLNSVHSFTESGIGPWLLVFLGIVAAAGIGLIAWRGDRLRAAGRIDAAVSRESAFLVNNLLFAGLAFVVLLGTVYPLLAEALQGHQLSVGEPYFSRMTTPLALALLFLMAVAPALPWRTTTSEVIRRRLLLPAYAGAGTMLVATALGARGLTTVLAFGLAAFAVAGVVRQYAVGIRARHRAEGEPWRTAIHRTVGANPRLYGGLVVHVGVVCVALALASFAAFTTKHEVRLARGGSATVEGYRVTYLGARTERSAQKTTIKLLVDIHHGGGDYGVYAPAISTFPNTADGIGTPSVRTGLLRDVYLTVVSSPNQQGRVTIGVAINAMVVWLWIGGGVIAIGTAIAFAPRLRRRKASRLESLAASPAVDAEPTREAPEVVRV
jgi:cytochrome c-type biogenesis protein CcmF